MNEIEEIKLRNIFYASLFDYFSDNLPAHLFPEQRIQSTVYDLIDILMDDYESYSKMERGHLMD